MIGRAEKASDVLRQAQDMLDYPQQTVGGTRLYDFAGVQRLIHYADTILEGATGGWGDDDSNG